MPENSKEKDKTTKTIALVLLYSFITSVSLLFFVNMFIRKLDIYDDDDLRKGWFDLLKNALVLLATALTTVIGYYFGQREGTIKAEQAAKDIQETDQKAENAVQKAYQQRDKAIKNTVTNANDPQESNTPSADQSDDSLLIPT